MILYSEVIFISFKLNEQKKKKKEKKKHWEYVNIVYKYFNRQVF